MLVIQNGVLITADGQRQMDLGISDGKIVTVEEHLEAVEGDQIIDAALCYVYPEWVPVGREDVAPDAPVITMSDLHQSAGIQRDLLLYGIITGDTEAVLIHTDSKTEQELLPGIVMHEIGDALDPYGYMKLLCENPAKMTGVYPKRGSLNPGSDADIIVWDPNVKKTLKVTPEWDRSATEYHGAVTVGFEKARIEGGAVIHQ